MAARADVSFQKEYDKIVNELKDDDSYFANITIEMMVATESNIREILN